MVTEKAEWNEVFEKNIQMLDDLGKSDDRLLTSAAYDALTYMRRLEEQGYEKYKICLFAKCWAEERGNALYDYGDEQLGDAYFEVASKIKDIDHDDDIPNIWGVAMKAYDEYKESWRERLKSMKLK